MSKADSHYHNFNSDFQHRHPHVHQLLMTLFYIALLVIASSILAVLAYAVF